MVERCVCCGDIIPEGLQVCPKCEAKELISDMKTYYYCDWEKRNKCDNSPWCVGNDGPCELTLNPKLAKIDETGSPIVYPS